MRNAWNSQVSQIFFVFLMVGVIQGTAYPQNIKNQPENKSLPVIEKQSKISVVSEKILPGDEFWDDQFTSGNGLDDYGWSIVTDDDDIYIGGAFKKAGNKIANRIAKWNELSGWSTLGEGLPFIILNIAKNGNEIFAGGEFTPGYISIWNGNSWSVPLGGANNYVDCFKFFGDDVYIGGSFTAFNGVQANRIAIWNRKTNLISNLGNGVNGDVISMAFKDNDLYAGGSFTTAGGKIVNRIARWNNVDKSWYPIGNGADNAIMIIKVIGDDIYFAGHFTSIGNINANRIAKWNSKTNTWSALGEGLNNYVNSMMIDGDDIYVVGNFTKSGNLNLKYIAKWNIRTNSWSALGTGFNGEACSIEKQNDNIYATGVFTTAGNKPSLHFARYRTAITSIPKTPVLFEPFDKALNISIEPVLSWKSSGIGSTYKLQISSAPDFSNVLIDQSNIVTPSVKVSGLTKTSRYYWRVSAQNTLGTSAWSEIFSFETSSTPYEPVLLYPANSTIGLPTNFVFIWKSILENVSFRLQVSKNPAFTDIILDQNNVYVPYFKVNGLIENTIYYWRVCSQNSVGISPWSTVFNFATTDISKNVPVLSLPANESIEVPVNPRMSWFALDGARYYKLQVSNYSNFTYSIINKDNIESTFYDITGLMGEMKYYWRVNGCTDYGFTGWSNTWSFTTMFLNAVEEKKIPSNYCLGQNYPNPFNPSTVIGYKIPVSGFVSLKVYGILGKEIATIVFENKQPGEYFASWNPVGVPSGLYYYKLQSGKFSETKKMLFVR